MTAFGLMINKQRGVSVSSLTSDKCGGPQQPHRDGVLTSVTCAGVSHFVAGTVMPGLNHVHACKVSILAYPTADAGPFSICYQEMRNHRLQMALRVTV